MKTKFFLIMYCLFITSFSTYCAEKSHSLANNSFSNGRGEMNVAKKQNLEQLKQKQKEVEAQFNKGLSQPLPELQGFTGLTFWTLPSFKEPSKKAAFVHQLEKLLKGKGQITIVNEENGISFEGFQTDAIVYLDNFPILIQNSQTNKTELSKNIERVDLKLMTPILIKKNGQNTQAEIYEKAICVDASDGFETVEQTALTLISELLREFFLANPNLEGKAQFFIYH